MRWDINIYLHAECTAYYQLFHAQMQYSILTAIWDGHIAFRCFFFKNVIFVQRYAYFNYNSFRTSYGFENMQAILGIGRGFLPLTDRHITRMHNFFSQSTSLYSWF